MTLPDLVFWIPIVYTPIAFILGALNLMIPLNLPDPADTQQEGLFYTKMLSYKKGLNVLFAVKLLQNLLYLSAVLLTGFMTYYVFTEPQPHKELFISGMSIGLMNYVYLGIFTSVCGIKSFQLKRINRLRLTLFCLSSVPPVIDLFTIIKLNYIYRSHL